MLRIIAGQFRGRKLETPPQTITRPTTDRVRESLFNLLTSRLASEGMSYEYLHVLDAFAGSGALGIEALSRGAKHLTCFEQNPKAYGILKYNLQTLLPSASSESDNTTPITYHRLDATKPPKTETPADLIFLDPPYGKNLIPITLGSMLRKGWIDDKTLVLCEMGAEESLPERFESFLLDQRVYGTIKVEIYQGFKA